MPSNAARRGLKTGTWRRRTPQTTQPEAARDGDRGVAVPATDVSRDRLCRRRPAPGASRDEEQQQHERLHCRSGDGHGRDLLRGATRYSLATFSLNAGLPVCITLSPVTQSGLSTPG